MYAEFNGYLKMEASVDYWGDVLIDDAEKALFNFTNEDWSTLKSELFNKNSEWLERCASLMGDIVEIQALEVLVELLPHSDPEVREVAIDSVRSLLSLGLDGRKYLTEIKSAVSNMKGSDVISSSTLDLVNIAISKMENDKLA